MINLRAVFFLTAVACGVLHNHRQETLTEPSVQALEKHEPLHDKVAWTTQTSLKDVRQHHADTFENLKILLLITTHLSAAHLRFMEQCWPDVVAKIPLTQKADVLVYSAKEPPAKFVHLFHNTTVHLYNNPGYQEGAIQAILDAEANGWMKGYDWVVRLNPDVIIRHDEWLRSMMTNKDVDGIFADCFSRHCTQKCTGNDVQTDFFAFRPSVVPDGAFAGVAKTMKKPGAEPHAGRVFKEYIIGKGRDRWFQGSKQHGQCRLQHHDVLHDHQYVTQCHGHEGEESFLQIMPDDVILFGDDDVDHAAG